jgi:tRNA pseudouridine synthase 10
LARTSVKKEQQLLIQQLEEHYTLCKYCLDRQVSLNGHHHHHHHQYKIANTLKCQICHGLMYEIDSIIDKILNTVNNKYQFDTFLIGATLPAYFYELEDQIRARFKIRGRENIKNQLVRELRRKFGEISKSTIDYLYPDIVINLRFEKENHVDIAVRMRPLIVFGRYIKKNRGISQRRIGDNRKKSEVKEYYGLSSSDNVGLTSSSSSSLCVYDVSSIQTIIAKELARITRGENFKFSWIGSEDSESLVSGTGRPFFVQIINPKVNQLSRNNLNFSHYGLFVNIDKYYKKIPRHPIQFTTKTKILIRTRRPITEKEVRKLNSLSTSRIIFLNQKNKSKASTKKIYSIDVKKITDTTFELILVADGGLAIKQFVEGQEYMNPNISDTIEVECECLLFDILDVWIRQS